MLSLFRKVRNFFKTEKRILEEFIQEHSQHLSLKDAEFHSSIHKEKETFTAMVYRVTKEDVEVVKQEILDLCETLIHDEGHYYMGHIRYAGQLIGFYMGISHELEYEHARFWLE